MVYETEWMRASTNIHQATTLWKCKKVEYYQPVIQSRKLFLPAKRISNGILPKAMIPER